MIAFPGAKINIGLRVTGKRHDGFHDIETIFYPVGLCDALEFVVPQGRINEDELVVTGINIGSRPKENLVMRALKKMREKYEIPFLRIHLHKKIPAAAGLGGGSSDAASLIKAINKCFDLEIDTTTLRRIALEVGSDCPFFIDPLPSYATGRGEILKPIDYLPDGLRIVLLNPGIRISTRDAYNNCIPGKPVISLGELVKLHPSEWREAVLNDFEQFVFRLYPEVEEIKKLLYSAGSLYSSMSGSGSTVYGIFDKKPEIPERIERYVIYEGEL
ncbi:MAG TPA: 4-(cytidine 5'-diphospho)-2-C-methyl-D-erythritol kinase [Bacteroidales bacterium]|nr:4-(cytidine 5'-diphospho)-2-C-methyl-D-erythritol kinase [Bacteroidales bacterium]